MDTGPVLIRLSDFQSNPNSLFLLCQSQTRSFPESAHLFLYLRSDCGSVTPQLLSTAKDILLVSALKYTVSLFLCPCTAISLALKEEGTVLSDPKPGQGVTPGLAERVDNPSFPFFLLLPALVNVVRWARGDRKERLRLYYFVVSLSNGPGAFDWVGLYLRFTCKFEDFDFVFVGGKLIVRLGS
ncbi:hypothetical protein Ddc_15154 [Ditylenchus destructor]|nr:hypothetical protein Ddc_15154 [Ditylenchus destructor]